MEANAGEACDQQAGTGLRVTPLQSLPPPVSLRNGSESSEETLKSASGKCISHLVLCLINRPSLFGFK